jgi:serine/threonine-protein kinase
MVDPKASRFWQAARQSGLIDEEALQVCLAAVPPEKREAEHLDRRLARQAVQQGKLSIWQAQQLMAGRSSGFKIDRYTLIEMIGQGGMGRVYLAKDTRLNRRVALKILSPDRMNNPRAIARFQREARVGAQLQHENLVRIYDEGEANGKCYLVMEYIEGKNIGAIIAENGPIPPATAARLGQQVALGLEHAQQKGLIHRDVNPYNILVTRDGIAKLTDLGLAIDKTEQAQVTREGATVGTFDYVSPEQARHSHAVDTRSDIYSLGCTLYHMLSGQVPFSSPSLPEKLFGHQAVDPMPLARLVPTIPGGLSEVVEKMMRKSPDDRYPTPLDVAQALEPYTDTPAGTIYASPGVSAVRSSGRSAMSETQVVDAPRMLASGPAPSVTEVTMGAVDGAPTQPAFARSSPSSTSTATRPSPAAGTDTTSRSNENWGELALGIDLGPEPSLTEGLQSGKKKSRSSSPGISAEPEPTATAPMPLPGEMGQISANQVVPAVSPAGVDGWVVDLGPEPPLSTHTQARGKAVAPRSADAATTPQAPKRRWLIGVGALAVGAAAAGILFGSGLFSQARSNGNGTTKSSAAPEIPAKRTPTRDARPKPAPALVNTIAADEVPPGEPIAVKMPDGVVTIEPNLKSAMQRAIGSKGHVLLNNSTPLKLSGPEAVLTIGGGRLYIRAAEGVHPVVEVEIQGQRPFLTTRADAPLTIAGVTFVARYRGKAKRGPALIQAGADLTLDRCAFTASGGGEGSRAVIAEGSSLTVSGCWFEGFATALDVVSFASSITRVKQSMMVRARTKAQPIGWALHIQPAPGGNTRERRRLVLEHCTAQGAGLLDLVDFSPQAALQVNIRQCAVMAEALLAWQTAKPGIPLTAEALDWKGEGNQYDIRGKSWVVLSAEGMAELPDGPVDLASWRAKAAEQDSIPPPVRFRVNPDSMSASPQPYDFAIIDPEVRPPGADPNHVGPTAPAERR